MKKIFLLLVMLLSLSMYSQTSSGTDETIQKLEELKMEIANQDINAPRSNAERIVDKYATKISNAFESGLEKVAPVAKEGFVIATKLQFAKGIVYLSIASLWFLFVWLTWRNYKIAKEYDDRYWIDGKCGGFALIFLIITILLTITLPFLLYHGLTHVIAPEWYAIKEIIEMFSGGVSKGCKTC